MRRLKVFGERIVARDSYRQAIEIHIRIALMNRFNALGRPRDRSPVQKIQGKGVISLQTRVAHNAHCGWQWGWNSPHSPHHLL
ncbi:hypothetical protein BD293_1041 [Roseinatronobacter monicus]|uniref:Transposase n=1 Tax=Roseinatronobacter monicus TaxID=393481 RepID=A0A543KBJ1_9RHOB|nr:hypothetical protein BD293_1041 [Roseinatronobacter monicus]